MGHQRGCTWPVFGTSIVSETEPIQWVSMAIAMLGYCGNCNRMTFYFRIQNTTSAFSRQTHPKMLKSSEDPAANTFRIHNHSMRFWVISSFQVHHGQGANPPKSSLLRIRQQNIGYDPKPCGSYLSICLSIHPSIHPCIYLSIYLSRYMSVYLSIHPSVYLSDRIVKMYIHIK